MTVPELGYLSMTKGGDDGRAGDDGAGINNDDEVTNGCVRAGDDGARINNDDGAGINDGWS